MAEWLRFIRFRLLLSSRLPKKRRGTRAKGFQSRFALSSCDPLVVQYAQKSMAEPLCLLKEKLASSLQWKKLGWGNFEMRGRQTKWTDDGRSDADGRGRVQLPGAKGGFGQLTYRISPLSLSIWRFRSRNFPLFIHASGRIPLTWR